MDPQSNPEEQIRISRRLLAVIDGEQAIDEGDVDRLASLVLALAQWRANGGFDPPDWPGAWSRGA